MSLLASRLPQFLLTQRLEGGEDELESRLRLLAVRESLEQKSEGQDVGVRLDGPLLELAVRIRAHVDRVRCLARVLANENSVSLISHFRLRINQVSRVLASNMSTSSFLLGKHKSWAFPVASLRRIDRTLNSLPLSSSTAKRLDYVTEADSGQS